jgi:hypothetical protein
MGTVELVAAQYIRPILLRVHKGAFEFLGAFIGRHLGNGLIPMAESDLVEDLVMRFAIDEHFQAPLLVILGSYCILDRGLEHDLLKYIEVTRVVLEILLELWLGEMMWVFYCSRLARNELVIWRVSLLSGMG